MQAQDITSYARTLQAEPNAGQRWTDAQLISFADRAHKIVIRALRWPESRLVFQSGPGIAEYQLPEIIRILRVYVGGQPIVRTDIPTLEGQQIQLNDQSGTGGGPAGLVSTTEAPTLSVGPYTPQWTSQPPSAYPVASNIGGPSPSAQPWFIGSRPRYYLRGGNIGFVPVPLAAYPVVIDAVAQPATLTTLTSACVLPDIALDCLAWKMCELMLFPDPSTAPYRAGQERATVAGQHYMRELGALQTWRKTMDGVGPRGPNILGLRAFYRGTGQHRDQGETY